MYSKIIPFENIIDGIKDETGIQNLRNLYPMIRRFIYRAERDIGFGYGLLLKKIDYKKSDGTILDFKIRLPEDLIKIEEVGTSSQGFCPDDYRHQGNFLFLCRDIDEFSLIYYAMLCDGEGNPAITENHFEAVLAGVKYFMYQPKMWNNEGSINFYKQLELFYYERIGEAIGNDVMPSTDREWSDISKYLKMSYRDMLIYSDHTKSYDCIPLSVNNEVLTLEGDDTDDVVYHWQYSDFTSNISLAPAIDQDFLDLQDSNPIIDFINGFVIPYSNVGRIAFAVSNVDENYYQIIDVFETDITSVVFDTYYNLAMRTQIYISKEVYTHGNIYYKLILN